MTASDAMPKACADRRLAACLGRNEPVWRCLERLAALDLPGWHLGAGCIAQTVWNEAHGKLPAADIADHDVVYFDPSESARDESRTRARVQRLLADIDIRVDVKNQARVHLWYEKRFGYAIRPYASCEDAIATWPTTATAIGVRAGASGLAICAPFGTADLFALVVRPNRVQITREVYAAKLARWLERWPSLVALPWERGVGVEGERRVAAAAR